MSKLSCFVIGIIAGVILAFCVYSCKEEQKRREALRIIERL